MSVLVVGLSHKSASLPVLERAVVSGDTLSKLIRDVSQAPNVGGTLVVSTCNRVEVYAEVDKFHGGVSSICDLLARHSGIPLSELTPNLYVHYEDRAVQHLLAVACGLESMVVGESQILGQVRQALSVAREHGTLSRGLGELGALALRTARRAHAETRIDQAGANLVSIGIAVAHGRLTAGLAGPGRGRAGPAADPSRPLAGLHVLVVGAGSMSSLAATTAARMGAAHIVVANRTAGRAGGSPRRSAAPSPTSLTWPDRCAQADLVISCTGAAGVVIGVDLVTRALARRGQPGRPLVLLDLAMPRDVDPAVAGLPGAQLVGLDTLGDRPAGPPASRNWPAWPPVTRMSTRSGRSWPRSSRPACRPCTRPGSRPPWSRCGPRRPRWWTPSWPGWRRLPADHRTLDEVERAMRRVVDKLLHAPTVRVKELAGSPGGDAYEDALRVLFDLDPAVVAAVTLADTDPGAASTKPDSASGATRTQEDT